MYQILHYRTLPIEIFFINTHFKRLKKEFIPSIFACVYLRKDLPSYETAASTESQASKVPDARSE